MFLVRERLLNKQQSFECDVGGRRLVIETGKLAGQAGGAVTVKYGDTVVLVTACVGSEPREGVDFLPLTIDYEEKMYAAGKIPGGFIRREGRPSESAILACRLVDRPLRPLLPKEWRNDIQIIATVLSADQESDPDILAVIGGSAALSISEVPFDGPVSAVHVGYIDGELVLNPKLAQLEDSQFDLVVASTKQAIVMIEAGAKEIPEDIVPKAIKFGHEANQDIIRLQEQLQQACGKPKVEAPSQEFDPDLVSAVASAAGERLPQALSLPDKSQREQALSELKNELLTSLEDKFSAEDMLSVFEAKTKTEIRAGILRGQRSNGRGLTEVRPISCEVGFLPRTHGSALFTRGQTQVLAITTLGSTRQEQQLDGLGIEETKRFMHHYNFPPFSTGEVKRVGSPGRREIGHGALAERSLVPVLPGEEDFPYAIRLVSEVLSSSGSTSMASACAGSLSLMDAGIPVKRAVAGIAMGLITGDNGEYVILTDIEGLEDAYGDMDFKIAGTSEGITALQMDTKLKGRMHKMMIDPDKIGSVIGAGGKTIRSIIEETKTTIDVNNDGTVLIGSNDEEAARRAIQIIEGLTKEAVVGDIYTGKVTRILDFGAMVEVLPGKEGLVHISELADYRVGKVEDVVKVGDEVTVKVIGIDNLGRVNLSRRAMFEKSSQAPGAGVEDSRSDSRSFRENRSRPPQRGYPPRGKPPYSGRGR